MQHRSCVDISDDSPRVTQTAALFCFLCYLLHMTAHSIIQHCQCCNQHNSKSCASHVGFSTGSCNCYLSGFLEVMQVLSARSDGCEVTMFHMFMSFSQINQNNTNPNLSIQTQLVTFFTCIQLPCWSIHLFVCKCVTQATTSPSNKDTRRLLPQHQP